ncbi:tRNA(Met) cytidine acetyltransferase TmcA [Tatumella saanichensis]|uniref:tRNA(Met) cytidine acetyltransferase TmcA n=1 Tax=Tatumella saanichensis TaxID=480813 RepID=UPI0004A36BA3|nr:GNAT family N-acetyltransferase [Tatumella saanichensis]
MISLAEQTAVMQRAGIRRLCVISGEADWVVHSACEFSTSLPGDWLTLSADPQFPQRVPAATASKRLLGQEFLHAIFDARQGFHAEALAALAGTLRAGSWLLLLLPPREQWPEWQDQDSLRWSEADHPLPVPNFMQHLQQTLAADGHVSYWYQHQPPHFAELPPMPAWHCRGPEQQQALLETLSRMAAGIAVVTAPRGRGKSALAGMLAKRYPGAHLSAPARLSVEVLQRFAGNDAAFFAPDALVAVQDDPGDRWLIIDEAAAIPAPLLQKMIKGYRRVLLCTTVQGYEGTGRGFLLKFCAGLPDVYHFSLSEPLRWSAQDPLEAFISALFLFDDRLPLPQAGSYTLAALPAECWSRCPQQAQDVYRLLTAAHYRTSPLDLRRMMDAPGMQFLLAQGPAGASGALWLLNEGGLDNALSEAVWAGYRRPKGSLVAQSLAAHAGFPEAAQLNSVRISRIAVQGSARRRGIGRALVQEAISRAAGHDFVSVSFGYTGELWQFWQNCGFRLVRLGTQREASSGCYTAMAILPLSEEGISLLYRAEQRLRRDAASLRMRWFYGEEGDCLPVDNASVTDGIDQADWQELAGFAWGSRPFEVAFPALLRLQILSRTEHRLVQGIALQENDPTEQALVSACGGRKAWLRALREEVAAILTVQQPSVTSHWQQRLSALRQK